jgi:hypothetical protein
MSDKTIENKETCWIPTCSVAPLIENHHVVTMEHELRVDGHHLIEKKQKTLIDGNDETLVLVHIRSIDEKSYKVTEINNDEDDALERQVESDMTEDEVKKFEEDWINLWNPDITQKEIEKLHQ